MTDQPLRTVIRHLRGLAAGPPAGDPSDQELLRRFTAVGDEGAFAALVRRHGPMVRELSRRLLGPGPDVDDAFQAVFLVLACQARSVRTRQSLAGWLYGVAYRTALRARRDAARRRRREDRPPPPGPADPAEQAAWRELCAALDAELCRLPEGQRAALVLCYLEGRTRDQAAGQLGLSVRTLGRRLVLGREQLRARLARRGLTLSGAALAAAVAAGAAEAAGVPAALVTIMGRAATSAAAGQVAAPDGIRAGAVALTQGVLKAMLRTRLKLATVALLVLGLLGTATGLLAFRARAQEPGAQARRAGAAGPPAAGEPAPAGQAAGPDVYALLLIEEREPQLLPDGKNPAPADGGEAAAFRRTQVVLLKSRTVLRAALRRPEAAGLAVLKAKADPVAWLEQNLSATFLDNTGVLRVSVGAGSNQERAALANAVADAYLEEVVSQEQRRKAHRLVELEKLRHEYEDSVLNRRQTLHKLVQARGVASSSLKEQFDREDLAQFRGELHRVRLAEVRAQARLNHLKGAGGKEGAREAVAKLQEEVAVLAEQEKLLNNQIAPLADAVQARARGEAAEGVDLASLREEIAAAEQIARKLAGEAVALQVELHATPRVRLLQKAEAPPPGK
jgi:RNA polymerase sigma factor (sigma-70 family)